MREAKVPTVTASALANREIYCAEFRCLRDSGELGPAIIFAPCETDLPANPARRNSRNYRLYTRHAGDAAKATAAVQPPVAQRPRSIMAPAALPSRNGGFQTPAHFAPQGGKVGRKYCRRLLDNGMPPRRRAVCPGFARAQSGPPGRHAKDAVARIGGASARGGAAAFSS